MTHLERRHLWSFFHCHPPFCFFCPKFTVLHSIAFLQQVIPLFQRIMCSLRQSLTITVPLKTPLDVLWSCLQKLLLIVVQTLKLSSWAFAITCVLLTLKRMAVIQKRSSEVHKAMNNCRMLPIVYVLKWYTFETGKFPGALWHSTEYCLLHYFWPCLVKCQRVSWKMKCSLNALKADELIFQRDLTVIHAHGLTLPLCLKAGPLPTVSLRVSLSIVDHNLLKDALIVRPKTSSS